MKTKKNSRGRRRSAPVRGSTLSHGVALAATLMVLMAGALVAQAQVRSTTDIAVVDRATVVAAGSVEVGSLTNDDYIQLFLEQSDVELTSDMPLDVTVPGIFTGSLSSGTLSAGEVVTSVMLHIDCAGCSGVTSFLGEVEFSEDILGVVITKSSLDAWDGEVGLRGVRYPDLTAERGLEYGGAANNDMLLYNNGVLGLIAQLDTEIDQIRVILPGHPKGVTFSIDAQGGTHGLPPPWGLGPITAADILTPAVGGPPGPNHPVFGPTLRPGVMLKPYDLGIFNAGTDEVKELDALSFGNDVGGRLVFSVDEFAEGAMGLGGPSVTTEGAAGADEASADIFVYRAPAVPPPPGFVAGNRAFLDGNGVGPTGKRGFGLIEPNPETYDLVPDDGDNLDAIDLGTMPSDLTGRVYFSLDYGYSDPYEVGMPPNYGTAEANGFSGADILTTIPGIGSISYFATATELGLNSLKDDIDALIVLDRNSNGEWEQGLDVIRFSLRRGSTTIGTTCPVTSLPICEGDVLAPGPEIFIPCEALGLLRSSTNGGPGDDLNALDRIRFRNRPFGHNDQGNGDPGNPGGDVVIPVLENDYSLVGELDPSSVEIFHQPQDGTITHIDPATGDIHYTPNFGKSGEDSFTYIVSDDSGETSEPITVTVSLASASGVDPRERPWQRTLISFAGPNPFSGGTAFRLESRAAGQASVVVYDLAGHRVRTLFDASLDAGESRVLAWDGRDERGREAATGVYLVRLQTATSQQQLRVTHMR